MTDWGTVTLAVAGIGGTFIAGFGAQWQARRYQLRDRREERKRDAERRLRARMYEVMAMQYRSLMVRSKDDLAEMQMVFLMTFKNLEDPELLAGWQEALEISTEVAQLRVSGMTPESMQSQLSNGGYFQRFASCHQRIVARLDTLGWPEP